MNGIFVHSSLPGRENQANEWVSGWVELSWLVTRCLLSCLLEVSEDSHAWELSRVIHSGWQACAYALLVTFKFFFEWYLSLSYLHLTLSSLCFWDLLNNKWNVMLFVVCVCVCVNVRNDWLVNWTLFQGNFTDICFLLCVTTLPNSISISFTINLRVDVLAFMCVCLCAWHVDGNFTKATTVLNMNRHFPQRAAAGIDKLCCLFYHQGVCVCVRVCACVSSKRFSACVSLLTF